MVLNTRQHKLSFISQSLHNFSYEVYTHNVFPDTFESLPKGLLPLILLSQAPRGLLSPVSSSLLVCFLYSCLWLASGSTRSMSNPCVETDTYLQ